MSTYKRSIFVINPGFQYKLSLIICTIVLISSLIYPLTIYDLFEKFIAFQPSSAAKFESHRNELLILLCVMQLALLGIIFVVSIFLTHKVAGPMYKLENYLINLKNGGEFKELTFRNGDYFPEIADEVSQTIGELINQREKDFEYLTEVQQYISNLSLVIPEDKKPVVQEILSNLATIQNRNKS